MSETRPMPIQFGTQLASHESGPLTQELAENLYLEPAPKGAKFQYTLRGTPGLKLFAAPQTTGPCRGMIEFDDKLFAVIGNTLYYLSSDGSYVSVGTIEGTSNVAMAQNGSWIWIANPGGALYAANATTVKDLSADLDDIVSMTSQDGYIIAVERNGNTMYLSELDTNADQVSSDFTTVDTQPGDCVSVISDHREVLVMKQSHTEAFYNSGASAFPFERTQIVERGCLAPLSVAKFNNAVFWLGDDLQVHSMSGYQPQPISNQVITRIIEKRSSPQTAVGWTYQQGGHTFYVLEFSDYCMVYDITTGLWHRRKSKNLDYWRATHHVFMHKWRKNLVGDRSNGNIYELSLSTYDENGTDLIRRAISAPVWNNGLRFVVDEFFLDNEAGAGITRDTLNADAWASSTEYSVGDLVRSNSAPYRCIKAGTSLPYPTGITGTGTSLQENADLYANAIKTLLDDIITKFRRHLQNIYANHNVSDTGNIDLTWGGAGATNTLALGIAAANALKANYNSHRTDGLVNAHPTDDDTNIITVADATSESTLLTLVNDIRAKYEAHRSSLTFHALTHTGDTMSQVAINFSGTPVWEYEVYGAAGSAILQWSNDGGKTWSAELRRSMGKIGEYELRARWHRLGAHRNWMVRIIISDPVPVRINGAYARVEMLTL